MRIILTILMFSFLAGCGLTPTQDDYDQQEELAQVEFDKACVSNFTALFPGQKIECGDWLRTWSWRQRLYSVGGRVFVCKQETATSTSRISVHPVEFRGMDDSTLDEEGN